MFKFYTNFEFSGNRYQRIFSLLIFFYIFSCTPLTKQPESIDGVLDLQHWDLNSQETLTLNGYWEFYWKEFVNPCGFEKCVTSTQKYFLYSPKTWNGFQIPHNDGKIEELTGEGYATYRLLIRFKEDGKIGFKVPNFGTAYRFFCNGENVLAIGVVGSDVSTSIPERKGSQLIICDTYHSKIEIIVQISNFHNKKGGLWLSINLGSMKSIRALRDSNLSLDLFLTGVILIMGLYHLAIFSLRSNEKSPLYFGIFCLIISLRIVITNENYLYDLVPWLSYNWGVTFEFLTIYASIPVFGLFIKSLFMNDSRSKFHNYIFVISSIISIIVLVTPPGTFTHTLPLMHLLVIIYILYILYILRTSIHKRIQGSKLFLTGFIFFSIAVINDILHTNYIINTGFFFPVGLVAFILCQSFILADRFSIAFKHIEDLTHNLENKVNERTSELKEAKIVAEKALEALRISQSQIIQSEKLSALGLLVSNVSHEINTPIGAIGANADNLSLSTFDIINSLNLIKKLSDKELQEIKEIILSAQKSQKTFSTKEERLLRNKLKNELNHINIEYSDLLCQLHLQLKQDTINKEYLSLWKHPLSKEIIYLIQNLFGIFEKARAIKISVQKTSRVTSSLKSMIDDINFGHMKNVNIIDGIEAVLYIYNNYINQGIHLIRDFQTIPHVYCNPESLNQVWTNIIFNAIQSLGSTKIIKISIIDSELKNKNGVLITIEDSGSGIPEEVLPKIFEPFFTTKKAGEGSGLGLYISKQIVEKHGGEIRVESSSSGTKFFIHLPREGDLSYSI